VKALIADSDMAISRRDELMNLVLGFIAVACLIPDSWVGIKLSPIDEDIKFLILGALLVSLSTIGWWRVARLMRDQNFTGWRSRITIAGCVLLSVSLLLPIAIVFFRFRWDFWFGCSVASLLVSFFAIGSVRFPLLLGSIAISSMAFLFQRGGW
jgi:hypothetical protein